MPMRGVVLIIILHAVMPVDNGQEINVGIKTIQKYIQEKNLGNSVRKNGEEIKNQKVHIGGLVDSNN